MASNGMDGRKKHKRPNKHLASIDGFVPRGRPAGGQPMRPYRPSRGELTPTLDSLVHRNDGFHARGPNYHTLSDSPEIAEAEALLDEPIVLEDEVEPKKRRWLRGRLKLTPKRIVLALMALIVVSGLLFYIYEHNIFRGGGRAPALAENIDINKLRGEGDGRINILLLGTGGPGHDGADLTDTILLVSIDPINHKTALLSIPRDLWVKIPGDGYQKLNAAYVYGKQQSRSGSESGKDRDGLALVDKTLEEVIGIPIHYHAVVNFKAFKQTVDALGGVTFYVPEALYDPTMAWENGGNPYLATKGTQKFDGYKALLYARSRETSSDFARGQRQRQLMIAIKDKALSLGTFSNPIKVSKLLSSLGSNVYTDFSLNDMMRLHEIMAKIPSKSITSLDLVTPPHDLLTTGSMNGLSIVRPKAGLFDYAAVQGYVRNALRDSFLAKENAKIAIYNATDVVGMATKQSDYLKSYGYNVTSVGNTAKVTNPLRTQIIDLTKGRDKYTKHYLEGRYKVGAVSNLSPSLGVSPPADTDFVIIIGKDVATSSQN